MKKGDVVMAKHFYKKYGNKGWAFDYPVSAILNKASWQNTNVFQIADTGLPKLIPCFRTFYRSV